MLLKNAGKVRDAGKLPAWLHGVAYKVCGKARRGAERRGVREKAAAVRDGAGSAVPDSAWDRALAAVHEEVAKLPETLRVPFVLCCLEGVGVTEAAERLGWKLGTLSGRLTRAKDAVLARLEVRGVALGVLASVGVVAVPTAVAAKAAALAQVGYAVPGSVLQLSQGVIGMSAKSVKMLAASVVLVCGLGLGVGNGWVASADAQQPGTPASPRAAEHRAAAEAERAAAERAAAEARTEREPPRKTREAVATFTTDRSEYEFVLASDMDMTKFANFLSDRDGRGWDYCGNMPLVDPKQSVLVFRRATKQPAAAAPAKSDRPPDTAPAGLPPAAKPDPFGHQSMNGTYVPNAKPKAEDAKAVEAEIARLTAKLKELQANPGRVVFFKDSLPLDPVEFHDLLSRLAVKKFGKTRCEISSSPNGVAVEGDREVTDWATGVVKSLYAASR